MDCNVVDLEQPLNVPVDENLYRLVSEYRYTWAREIDPEKKAELDSVLYPPSVAKAKKELKNVDGQEAMKGAPGGKSKGYSYTETSCLYNRIAVPSGFTYDGASVPRIAWSITGIRPDGLLRAAAAVHDWIYQWKGQLPRGSHAFRIDEFPWQDAIGRWRRKDCDRLFGRMMREAGVPSVKRKMAYLAVRLLGGLSW